MGAAHPERGKDNPEQQGKAGLLNKQGNGGMLHSHAWKQRYFVLERRELKYYREEIRGSRGSSHGDRGGYHAEPRGSINLSAGDVKIVTYEKALPGYFEIHTPVRVYNLRASSRQDFVDWLQVLRRACRPVWEADSAECSICAKDFSMFIGRHHCRACGLNICSSCCARSFVPLEHLEYPEPVRVCKQCHRQTKDAGAGKVPVEGDGAMEHRRSATERQRQQQQQQHQQQQVRRHRSQQQQQRRQSPAQASVLHDKENSAGAWEAAEAHRMSHERRRKHAKDVRNKYFNADGTRKVR